MSDDQNNKISSEQDVQQPRQPQSLQGLLRFAMEATKSEDAPGKSELGPLDDQRKQFLEKALKSLTIDVIEILQKNVRLLQNAENLSVDSDISEYTNAFELIVDYIDNIDTANDFHKIGGFTIFKPCLYSIHTPIRFCALDLLAELCQNNPYCQRVVIDNNILPIVLNILDTDVDERVCVKAVYAISCNIRENEEGYEQFIKHDGVPIMLRALAKPIDKLRTKTSFLLSCLSSSHADLRDVLCAGDIIPLLMSLIVQERMSSHEHMLSLFVNLITDNPNAIVQCTEPKYNFKNILADHLRLVKDKIECLEEAEYCQILLSTIFKGESNEADR